VRLSPLFVWEAGLTERWDVSLEIFAFFMLTGIFSTLLLPETKGLSLEELSHENQEGFVTGELAAMFMPPFFTHSLCSH
jgi:hypothetical protein